MRSHRDQSYSPRRRGRSRSPPYTRGKHYDDPRDHRRTDYRRRSPPPSGLLVRNIPLHTRPEELRIPFENFGPVKDVYLPRDYYTGEPRGFGFVKFRYPEDAAKAKDKLNYTDIGGREIRIVYAEENRKTPREMRKPEHTRYEGKRRTPVRSSRGRYHSRSRSPVTKRRDSRSASESPSRHTKRDRSRSPFNKRDGSRSPLSERDRSRSPRVERDLRSNRSMSPRKKSPDGKEYKRRVRTPSPRDADLCDQKQYKLPDRADSPRQMPPHDEDYRSPKKSRDASPCDEKVLRSPKKSVSPHDEKVLRSSKRSVSPHNEDYQSSRRSSKRSRDISPHDEKLFRSSKRSVSPRREFPLGNDSADERENQRGTKSPSPRKTGSRVTLFSNGNDVRSSG